MDKQSQESQIRNQLSSKWPKVPANEVKDILSHHDHLRTSLKTHYKLDDVEARKEEKKFFKSYETKPKKTGTRF